MKHIDYDVEARLRTWWLNSTGGAAKEGLTVRDYFAAEAMTSVMREIWPDQYDNRETRESIVETAYRMADAMMQARVLDKQGEL